MAEVETSREGAVLTIVLNRPEVLNALNGPMHAALQAALAQARDPSVRAVLLTGSGRGFCVGQDLQEFRAGARDVAESLRERFHPHVLAIRSLEKPVIAAVNGAAAGAGLSLALACDARIAANTASFVPAFIGIGLVPDTGGTWFAHRLLGAARAFEWLATGRRLSADEALEWGLVSEVVAADELAERAAEVAQLFAAMPTRAVWETKRLLDEAETAPLERQLEHEALTQAKLVGTPDFEEGVAAFLEKREAHFTGSSGEPFHPIELTNADDRRRWRLTVAIRVLLAIPHLYLFYYWTLVAVLVSLVNWPITLVRGRSPRGVHLWLSRYLRHATHAFAYVFLMADEFPRFRGWEGTYAVDLAIAETPLSQPRWKTLFRIVLAIPPVVLASLLFLSVLPVVALLAWFFALATARMPKGFQSLGAYCLRYTAQTAAYVLLLTDRYPSLATRDVTLDAPPRS